MTPTGSIKKVGDRFQWNYQSDAEFLYGYEDTMEAAQKALEEASSRKDFTVDDFFNGPFMDWKVGNLKSATILKYHLIYDNRIHPVLGSMNLTDVTSMQIETFLTGLVQDPNTSPVTCSVVKGMVSCMFKRAFRMKLIPRNPFIDIELPKNRKKATKRLAFTEKELEEVLRRAERGQNGLVFKMGAWCGMREGEIIALQWEDIDWKNGLIKVRHTLEYLNGDWVLTTPKSETSARNIPISKEHLMELKKHGESRQYQECLKKAAGRKIKLAEGLGEPDKEIGTTNFVFLTREGKPFRGSSVSRRMKEIVTQMKMEGLLDKDSTYTFHSLRHSWATIALRRGMSVKVVSELLGHSSSDITLEIYTHVMEEDKRREMKESGMLDGPTSTTKE